MKPKYAVQPSVVGSVTPFEDQLKNQIRKMILYLGDDINAAIAAFMANACRKETIEINYHSSNDFPAIGQIIEREGKKYRVIDNNIRNVTTAELVSD